MGGWLCYCLKWMDRSVDTWMVTGARGWMCPCFKGLSCLRIDKWVSDSGRRCGWFNWTDPFVDI